MGVNYSFSDLYLSPKKRWIWCVTLRYAALTHPTKLFCVLRVESGESLIFLKISSKNHPPHLWRGGFVGSHQIRPSLGENENLN